MLNKTGKSLSLVGFGLMEFEGQLPQTNHCQYCVGAHNPSSNQRRHLRSHLRRQCVYSTNKSACPVIITACFLHSAVLDAGRDDVWSRNRSDTMFGGTQHALDQHRVSFRDLTLSRTHSGPALAMTNALSSAARPRAMRCAQFSANTAYFSSRLAKYSESENMGGRERASCTYR